MSTAQIRPVDWKNYEDFADGIATNRLPSSDALVGRSLRLRLSGWDLSLDFDSRHEVHWTATGALAGSDRDGCEVIAVAPDTYFIDLKFGSRPLQTVTLIVNLHTLRSLAVLCRIRDVEEAGAEPRVAQEFQCGTVISDDRCATGTAPQPTRELIGLRTWQVYSPEHTYEHTYLSSERYAWQCLVGVQRGQGDVDMASYWKFADDQYLFTFREFLIPVASVFFFNFASGRSTGKFIGLTGDGQVANHPAGAFMHRASMTQYPPDFGPI